MVVVISPLSAQFAGGDGTEENPYLVADADQLDSVRNYPEAYFRQIDDIDLINYTGGNGWEPIGWFEDPSDPNPEIILFKGSYDGNGFVISNLYIDKPSHDYIGLFGMVSEAIIRNVTIIDAEVNGFENVGILAGLATRGLTYERSSVIENCHTSGVISFSYNRAGGIAGSIRTGTTVTDSSSNVEINDVEFRAGGLIGDSFHSYVFNSQATGNIGNLASSYIGGLIGIAQHSEIENCNSSADVTGYYYVGGLIGYCYTSMILTCWSEGDVIGGYYVGGLTGVTRTESVISDSYSLSNVDGTIYGVSIKAGGLAGYLWNSKAENSYAIGSVAGVNQVGGLVGCSFSYSEILNCFSVSDVYGYEDDIGGLVGLLAEGCEITNCYSISNIAGSNYVGGLIGASLHNNTVNKSYSASSVASLNNVGGLIGYLYNSNNATNSYWDIDIFAYDNDIGEGKTTLEMLQESTYTGWHFDSDWSIRGYHNNPYIRKHYPSLQWQKDNISHNRIAETDAHVKVYRDRKIYWESFPRLQEQDDHYYTAQLLSPLAGIITKVRSQNEEMNWDDEDGWTGHPIGFNSIRGYEIYFDTEYDHYLWVNGERISFYEEITLEEDIENWIGYFFYKPQDVFYAFGSNVIDQLSYVKAEDWSIHWLADGDEWIHRDFHQESTAGKLFYGKMYKVRTRVDHPVTFSWNLPPEYQIPPRMDPIPKPEYFTCNELSDYESIFIEDMENDDDILEVAVYAGEECVGASVFEGEYPLELLAYTNESHIGEDLSFAILREGQRSFPERVRVVCVRNNISGEYTDRILQPLNQRFSVVRLYAGDGDLETVIPPSVSLSQNYPNPLVFGTASRSHLTEIPFYVSETREVSLTLYNIKGQRVRTLFSGTADAGRHSIGWNGLNEQNRPVGSGIYFYRLESGDQILTRKMLLIR